MASDLSFGERSRGATLALPAHGTVIVATGGDDDSLGALIVGRQLARRLDSAIELVSVLEPPSAVVPSPRQDLPPLHRGATRLQDRRERLGTLCQRALEGEPRFTTRMLIGDVPISIATAARCHRARLVVTGRILRGRIERALRRETPLAVARAVSMPVLSVPPATATLPRIVVVAVGGGQAALRLGPIARALFQEAVAVHLVSVEPLVAAPWEREARDREDEHTHRTQRAFATVRASWKLPADVPIETHTLSGDEGDALASFARTVGADLLVVGVGQRPPGLHLPVADLATKLYRAASCATLLVPVPGHATPPLAAATTVSLAASEWPSLLREFAQRNDGRLASLMIDELGGSPRAIAHQWTLSGVDCDRDVGAIAIMLADPEDPRRHLSHVVARPTVLALHGAPTGCDDLLVIGYAGGQLTLCLS